jgi:hypothetical protein
VPFSAPLKSAGFVEFAFCIALIAIHVASYANGAYSSTSWLKRAL